MADTECDRCGAMLPLPDSTGYSTCLSCGSATRLEVRDHAADAAARRRAEEAEDARRAGETRVPPATARGLPPDPSEATTVSSWSSSGGRTHSTTTVTTVRSERRGCGFGLGAMLGCLPVLVALGGVGWGVVTAMRQPGGPLAASSESAHLYPLSGSATVLPGEPSGPSDIVLLATDNGNDSARVVTRVVIGGDVGDGELRWKSDPLPSDVYTASFAADAETLYVGAGDEVRSLSLRTGEERWRASLSDKVTTGCPECFRLVAGTLVVRTDDSYLTGFRTDSAEPRWSRRLSSPAAAASIVGESILLVDDPADAGALTEVTTIAPADGAVVRTFAPSCPPSQDLPWPIEMSAGDPVHAVPGTGDLVAAFGFGYGCIVRWEAATGAVRWTTPLPDGNFEDEQPPVLTATDLVVTKTSGSLRVDLATGRTTPLEAVPDADTLPRAIVGTTLLAETTSTRGTTRGGLAAFELASGRRLWSTQLESGAQPVSRGRYRSSDALFDGSPRTLLVTTGPTPVLLTFEGEGREILRQELDVATGELTRGTTRQFVSRFGSSGTPSITVESVDARSLLLSVDSILEVVPLSGEGPITTWPEPR